jgi:glycine/sarcosine N-methyltransferase
MDLSQDNYQDFAERYDLFFGDLMDPVPEVYREFFHKMNDDYNVRSILDCACGTGRDLILFHSLGYDVAGSDISESMLTQTRKNLSLIGLDIPLAKVDYRELPQNYSRRFDAVTCLSGAIDEMPNDAEVLKAFRSIHKVLNPGGILILSQGTTDRQWRDKPRFIPMVNRRDFSRICVIDYFEKGACYNILDIFHGDTLNEFKVWSRYFAQFLLRDDLERLLKIAGYRSIEFYGSYQLDSYIKESSNRLIAIALK